MAWIYGRLPVDRLSDKLINDKPNKYSAYYHYGNNPLLQNGFILKAIRALAGSTNAPSKVRDDHANFSGVSTHENALFLYQSKQAKWVNKASIGDYASLTFLFLAAFVPKFDLFILPFLISLMKWPRRHVQMRYFTWHAELLPHTE